MFDISLGELAVVGAVALVVIGPEKLPKVARTAGMLFGRAQRFVANVKADLDRELKNAELAQLQEEISKEAGALKDEFSIPAQDAWDTLQEAERSIMPPAAETQTAPATPPAIDERQLDLFAPPSATAPVRDRR